MIASPPISPNAPAQPSGPTPNAMGVPPDLRWRDVRDWGVEGKGWPDTEAYFEERRPIAN